MHIDANGLYTDTFVYDTTAGDDLLKVAAYRMQKGRSLGMSIGFRTVRDHWDSKAQARIIDELELVEYSFLASPALAANPYAQSLGIKSRRDRKQAGGSSTFEASYEDLQGDLQDAAADALRVDPRNVQVCATYVDHVIVRCCPDGMFMPGPADDDDQFWDFPYTLDDDGEPSLGDPKPVQPGWLPGQSKAHIGQLAKEKGKRMPPAPEQRATWSAADINNLPDSAFAYVEPGGSKDDDGRTVPRRLRHFPHHTAGGELDLPHLRNALARAPQSPFADKAMGHLEKHAAAEGIGGRGDGDGKSLVVADMHDPLWSEGVAPSLLVLSMKLRDLANDAVSDRLAMERLGLDTKKGARLNSAMRAKLKDLHGTLGQILAWAESIEAGEDGKRRVDFYKHKLALAALEVA